MKKFTKNLWVSATNGFLGKVLLVVFALIVGSKVSDRIFPGEGSSGNAGIMGIFEDLVEAIARNLLAIVIIIYWLLTEKIQAGITKEENKDETEIKKLELQNRQLELQNKQLELQKENKQSPPKNDEN